VRPGIKSLGCWPVCAAWDPLTHRSRALRLMALRRAACTLGLCGALPCMPGPDQIHACRPSLAHRYSPVHSCLKFSAVLGHKSAQSSILTRPTGCPPMDRSAARRRQSWRAVRRLQHTGWKLPASSTLLHLHLTCTPARCIMAGTPIKHTCTWQTWQQSSPVRGVPHRRRQWGWRAPALASATAQLLPWLVCWAACRQGLEACRRACAHRPQPRGKRRTLLPPCRRRRIAHHATQAQPGSGEPAGRTGCTAGTAIAGHSMQAATPGQSGHARLRPAARRLALPRRAAPGLRSAAT